MTLVIAALIVGPLIVLATVAYADILTGLIAPDSTTGLRGPSPNAGLARLGA